MFVAYLRTFARMGLKAIPMRADTGPIGGDLSHEFIILADTGESAVFCHKGLVDKDILSRKIDYASDLQSIINEWTSLYAATDEMHDAKAFEALPEGDRLAARGIEVGHIFYFGTKYSKLMNAVVTGPGGEQITVEMGSYGIGVSRLVGGIIEASHDDAGIVWPGVGGAVQGGDREPEARRRGGRRRSPEALRRSGGQGCRGAARRPRPSPGRQVRGHGPDRHPLAGHCRPEGLAAGKVELKNRKTGAREELPLEQALAQLIGKFG